MAGSSADMERSRMMDMQIGGGGPSPLLVRNLVILACAVDAADKCLLPAVFKAMDEEMILGPSGLATMIFAQSIAFALALPVWGSLMRYYSAQSLMACGCLMWGLTTLMLSMASTLHAHVALRVIVGFALASVNPLGQAMICDVVQEHERGWAFGLLQGVSSALSSLVAFGATAISSREFMGYMGWRWAHVLVAVFSILTGLLLRALAGGGPLPQRVGKDTTWFEEQRRVLNTVGSMPTFYIMVAQGVTGGVPWNALAFLTFYFQLSGYSNFQAGHIMLMGGIAGVLGCVFGGWLGDWFSSPSMSPKYGRCMVAQASVVLGIGFFVWMMNIPFDGAGSVLVLVVAAMLFNWSAVWVPAAALRPMCGELFSNPQDRAQIVALWVAAEGIMSSFFGAPLVSLLAHRFGYTGEVGNSVVTGAPTPANNVIALRQALIAVSVIPWALCALAWCPMYYTYPRDKQRSREREA